MATKFGPTNELNRFRSAINGAVPPISTKLKPLQDSVVFLENSYGAQAANVDYIPRALIRAGCRPLMRIGTRQARGGDTLVNGHDRIAPVISMRSKLAVVMNVENDLGDVVDATGGVVLKARLDQIRADFAAVYTPPKIIARQSADTKGRRGKPTAAADYFALMNADANYKPFRDGDFFQPYNADQSFNTAQSSDQVHPNTFLSGNALGVAIGASIAEEFEAGSIWDGGPVLPNSINLNPFSNATAWTATPNTSGLSCVQSAGSFAVNGDVLDYREFAFTGTSTLDPSINATTMDFQLRLAVPLAPLDTFGLSPGTILVMYVASASGGNPIGLASLTIGNGVGSTFNKIATPSEGAIWDAAFFGTVPILPETLTGQTSSLSFDLRVRGKQNVAADFVVRIARVNIIENDREAYGEPVWLAGEAFTAGKPVMKIGQTTSPINGATIAVGQAIGFGTAGVYVGGGATRTLEIERDGVIVGTATPIKRQSAAVPYVTVAADSGKVLSVYSKLVNSMGTARKLISQITVS